MLTIENVHALNETFNNTQLTWAKTICYISRHEFKNRIHFELSIVFVIPSMESKLNKKYRCLLENNLDS